MVMKKPLVVILSLCLAGLLATSTDSLRAKSEGKLEVRNIYGRIQYVESFPDYKVQKVSSFPDLKVQVVDSFPDGPGKWQIVDSFPDYKIQIVESFPDFTVQFVDNFPGPAR